MATLKIAPTLLNSFDFYIGCPVKLEGQSV